MDTKVSYCLQVKATKKILHLRSHKNAGALAYYLTDDATETPHLPVFTLGSPEKMALFLQAATPGLSFDIEQPSLSKELANEVTIIKMTQTIESASVAVLPPLTILYSAKKIALILKKYANEPVQDDFSQFALVVLPDGETIESMQRFKGKGFLKAEKREWAILGNIFPVPEDYEELLEGKLGFAAAIKDVDFADL